MRRRSLLALGLTAPLAPAPDHRRIGRADVRELQDAAVRLYGLDARHGGAELWRAAEASARAGYDMLEHGSFGAVVEKQLLQATGNVQICAGWLAFDTGRHDVARRCYAEALVLARQADDAEAETRVLANMAFQSNVLGRPQEALRLAEGAAARPHGRARLAAIPHLRRSVALAMSRDVSGMQKSMAQARRIIDRDHGKPAEKWYAFLRPAEMDGVEGTCLLDVDQPRRAAAMLERAIAAHDDRYARNRALYKVRLARARLDIREVDGAAEAATSALSDLGAVGSGRITGELSTVAGRLAQFPAVPGVQRFQREYARR